MLSEAATKSVLSHTYIVLELTTEGGYHRALTFLVRNDSVLFFVGILFSYKFYTDGDLRLIFFALLVFARTYLVWGTVRKKEPDSEKLGWL